MSLPSKRTALRAPGAATLIARSDANAEDLEQYAAAGLYDRSGRGGAGRVNSLNPKVNNCHPRTQRARRRGGRGSRHCRTGGARQLARVALCVLSRRERLQDCATGRLGSLLTRPPGFIIPLVVSWAHAWHARSALYGFSAHPHTPPPASSPPPLPSLPPPPHLPV